MSGPGVFVAVVGPSGAGKDTLMREAVRRRPDLVLARRAITRPPAEETEEFQSLGPEDFEYRRAAGGFALDWRAHGLSYGIPAAIEADLAAGRIVLANLSRGVLGAARARFPGLGVVLVTAPEAVLAWRLRARGREDALTIRDRLARAPETLPEGLEVRVVDNAGRLEDAVTAFLAALPQPARATR